MDAPENRRETRRSALDERYTSIEINGEIVRARVVDLSEGGMRLALPANVTIAPNDEVNVAIDKVIPNVRGRVRWVSADPGAPDARVLGVKFESFMINPVEESEIQDIIDAWMDVSHAFSNLDHFLRIVELIDGDIIDGKIDDIGEGVVSVTVWLERNVVPVNLWTLIEEPDGDVSASLTVERTPVPGLALEARAQGVRQAGLTHMTAWTEGRACFYGESIVLECVGDVAQNGDLLQHVTILLGRRIPLWSKLLIKNIAMRLLADELDRMRARK